MKSFIFSLIALFITTSTLFASISEHKWYHVQSKYSERFMDVKDNYHGNNGKIIQNHPDFHDFYQKWKFKACGGNYFFIKNKRSGKYLEAMKYGNQYDGYVYQYEYDGTDSQKWKLISCGNGYYFIKNKRTGKYLHIKNCESGNAYLVQKHGESGSCSKWKLRECEEYDNEEEEEFNPYYHKYYTFECKVSGKFMDVKDNYTGNNGKIIHYAPDYTHSQKWKFQECGGGYFFIKNKRSGKYLEAMKHGNDYNGYVYQYHYDGTDSQKWKLISCGNGYYFIKNKRTGKYLTTKDCSSSAGYLVQKHKNNQHCQKWRVKVCEN